MTAVFLDLDGTLMDSKPGILSSIHHAFHAVGRADLTADDLTWMIGPPFQDSFVKLGLDDPDAAILAYREHYTGGGMFNAKMYDGVFHMMDSLRAAGARLYLATAKPHAYACKITAHFGIAEKMHREFGPELDGTRNWKGDLLAHALAETGEDPKSSVMVGDRHHDIAAAKEVGMASIAACWGYGMVEEWEGAAALAEEPGAIPGIVSKLGLA